MSDLPEGDYHCVIMYASLQEVPVHVKAQWPRLPDHSINVALRVAEGEYKGTRMFDTLYPQVDQHGRLSGGFRAKLIGMGYPADDPNIEFDTDHLNEAHVIACFRENTNGKKKVVMYQQAQTFDNIPQHGADGTIFDDELARAKDEMARLLGD